MSRGNIILWATTTHLINFCFFFILLLHTLLLMFRFTSWNVYPMERSQYVSLQLGCLCHSRLGVWSFCECICTNHHSIYNWTVTGLGVTLNKKGKLTIILFLPFIRYVAICKPFLSHTMSKLSRAVKFILGIWAFAVCLAIPAVKQKINLS